MSEPLIRKRSQSRSSLTGVQSACCISGPLGPLFRRSTKKKSKTTKLKKMVVVNRPLGMRRSDVGLTSDDAPSPHDNTSSTSEARMSSRHFTGRRSSNFEHNSLATSVGRNSLHSSVGRSPLKGNVGRHTMHTCGGKSVVQDPTGESYANACLSQKPLGRASERLTSTRNKDTPQQVEGSNKRVIVIPRRSVLSSTEIRRHSNTSESSKMIKHELTDDADSGLSRSLSHVSSEHSATEAPSSETGQVPSSAEQLAEIPVRPGSSSQQDAVKPLDKVKWTAVHDFYLSDEDAELGIIDDGNDSESSSSSDGSRKPRPKAASPDVAKKREETRAQILKRLEQLRRAASADIRGERQRQSRHPKPPSEENKQQNHRSPIQVPSYVQNPPVMPHPVGSSSRPAESNHVRSHTPSYSYEEHSHETLRRNAPSRLQTRRTRDRRDLAQDPQQIAEDPVTPTSSHVTIGSDTRVPQDLDAIDDESQSILAPARKVKAKPKLEELDLMSKENVEMLEGEELVIYQEGADGYTPFHLSGGEAGVQYEGQDAYAYFDDDGILHIVRPVEGLVVAEEGQGGEDGMTYYVPYDLPDGMGESDLGTSGSYPVAYIMSEDDLQAIQKADPHNLDPKLLPVAMGSEAGYTMLAQDGTPFVPPNHMIDYDALPEPDQLPVLRCRPVEDDVEVRSVSDESVNSLDLHDDSMHQLPPRKEFSIRRNKQKGSKGKKGNLNKEQSVSHPYQLNELQNGHVQPTVETTGRREIRRRTILGGDEEDDSTLQRSIRKPSVNKKEDPALTLGDDGMMRPSSPTPSSTDSISLRSSDGVDGDSKKAAKRGFFKSTFKSLFNKSNGNSNQVIPLKYNGAAN